MRVGGRRSFGGRVEGTKSWNVGGRGFWSERGSDWAKILVGERGRLCFPLPTHSRIIFQPTRQKQNQPAQIIRISTTTINRQFHQHQKPFQLLTMTRIANQQLIFVLMMMLSERLQNKILSLILFFY